MITHFQLPVKKIKKNKKSACNKKSTVILSFLQVQRNGNADVAQLAEQLICNQQVIGSSPIIGFSPFRDFLFGPLAQLVRAIGS